MKRLLAIGDSFTYGEELTNTFDAWPYLLGHKIGYSVTNMAQPSKSNDYILSITVQLAKEYDLVVIAWSHFARMEFADQLGKYDIWPGNRGNLFTGDVAHRKNLIEYINRYHNDEHLYSRYLTNIILAQSYLDQHSVPYVMLDAFGNTTVRTLDQILNKQINQSNFLGWPDESMMEWTYGCPQGPNGHFLEQGHAIVADKIYEHIRNLSWVS